MKKSKSSSGAKRTVGLLLDWFTAQYHLDIWSGIAHAAQLNNVNLYSFIGGRLQAPSQREAECNIIFELAHENHVDGLLILATVGELLSSAECSQFIKQYHPLPIVSISEFPDVDASVLVDNVTGLRGGLAHLISVHNCKKIAYLGGPKENPDAQQRLNTFRKVLQKHYLDLDETQIYYGDFLYRSGYQFASNLVQSELEYDAIVAANDNMAVGVLEAFDDHGIKVPGQIAVIGFDDEEESLIATPPLTTVRQPTAEIGFQALERLLEAIEGNPDLPKKIVMPTKLAVRQSCGCQIWAPTYRMYGKEEEITETAVSASKNPIDSLQQKKEKLLKEMDDEIVQYSLGHHDPQWLSQLFDAVQDSIHCGEIKPLLLALDVVMYEVVHQNIKLSAILDSTAVLFRFLVQHGAQKIGTMDIDTCWQEIHMLIDSVSQRALLNRKLRISRDEHKMRGLGLELISQQELSGVLDVLVSRLPEINVQQLYLVLYDKTFDQEYHHLPERSRLVLAYDESGYVAPNFDQQHFRTKEMLPSYLFPIQNQSRMIVLPLYSYSEQFGYLIINLAESATPYNYDSLRIHLSIALQGVLPKIQLLDHRKKLEYEVTSQAYELALANEQLKTYMTKLEQRNQSLRQFTHVASHEFQEPLRKIQIFCDRVIQNYGEHLDEKGRDYILRLHDSSARLQHLVKDLLNFTQVTRQSRFQDIVDLNVILKESKADFYQEITAVNAQIDSDDLPAIEANASQMRQIFYNLLANSLKFRRQDDIPKITIESQLLPGKTISDHHWQITFADNGIGFDEKYGEKIFGMFQRLHSRQEYEGTGIGLAVCQRIVELHNGHITAKSKPNQGSQFIIILPASQN